MSTKREFTTRERILAALNHEEADRIAMTDGPWGTTIARWRKEGLPEGVSPHQYFGFDPMPGYGADTSFQFKHELVEETDTYRVDRNANGALVRNWKHQTSTPEMIDFLIRTPDDWEQHKHRLAWNENRVNWDAAKSSQNARAAGQWVHYSGVCGYDKTQGIIGSENLLVAMLEEPDWIAEVFMTWANMIVDSAKAMLDRGFVFDGAFLFDDMGYRNASLFSPALYRKLAKPAHAKAFGFFRERGMPVILHSCGCVKELIPDLIDAGLSCLQPLEVKAGMDLIELKDKYGDKLAFMGGIDVRKMANPDPTAIEEEVRTKVPHAKKGGGYIYHSDHSVPDNVSFQQYCRTIELVREYGKYE
jgi:uroporphyrinogen decarboxylase